LAAKAEPIVNPRNDLSPSTGFWRGPGGAARAGFARSAALAALLAFALCASGCGRKGALEPPPDPSAIAKPADADPTHLQARHKPPPIVAPSTPFVLDPLL
jgi:predicted small lipoprotein YifL